MQITTLRALADNYIFMISDDSGSEAAAVDPGDADPVLRYLENTGCPLTAILNTHHHEDHTGGNRALLDRFPDIPVFAGSGDRGHIPGQSHFLVEGDEIAICGARARVLEVPGHTKAHIAYYFFSNAGGDLFSGDTVFGGTIGNLFEETPDVMFRSIRKIRELPPGTKIWCSHEYTLQYVRESAGIDQGNERLARRLKRLEAAGPSGVPTVPLTLEEERSTNPFFRWDDPVLAVHLAKEPGIEVFRRLCEIT
jgi:hydroxyacylglutathione hydrolase